MKFETVLIAIITAMCLFGGIVWMSGGAPPATTPPIQPRDQPTDRPQVSPNPPHPKAVVDTEIFEFGVMQVGGKMSHTFVVRNEGEAPLEVQKGFTDCKCTMSELKEGSVPVGGSVDVELTWQPLSVDDVFEKRAVLYTNDPDKQELSITIRGRVTEFLVLDPMDGDWNLGTISEMETTESTGGLFSPIVDEFAIERIETSQDYIEVETTPMTDDELAMRKSKSGFHMVLRVAPEMPDGFFRENFTVHTDLPAGEGQEITFRVSGRRLGPIQIVPVGRTRWYPQAQVLDLGRFSAAEGATGKLSVSVQGLNDEEWQLTDLEVEPQFLHVALKRDDRFTVGDRQRYELSVEIPPGSPRATRTREVPAKIRAKTNHPVVGELDFRVVFISL